MDSVKINPHTKVVVLTGAGISAESGLKTFRDSDGLWEDHRIETVATPQAFIADPELVWSFYLQRYRKSLAAQPNPGHYALVELEKYLKANFTLITQNVDGLHQRAGSINVREMHGRLEQCFCTDCGKIYHLSDLDLSDALPRCSQCEFLLRPDIVWFGEIPYYLDKIDKVLNACEVFIVIGTSGVVYPAAGFVMTAKYRGAQVIGINLEQPENMQYIDFFFQGKSGDILPQLVQSWLPR